MNSSQTRIPDHVGGGMSDALLARLSSHVASHMGLHFPLTKWPALEKAFNSAAGELGFDNPEECANWFITTPITQELVESMAGYLTIGETYFLRENRSFEIFTAEIIPEIIRKRCGDKQRLRIWSAGCATGEEPYSMAILLDKMNNALKEWNIFILATDINPKALRKATDGIYTEWSFRNTPSWLKENYFRKSADGRLQLISQIKKMVDFSYLNLVEDFYPSLPSGTNAMDVIFCRNVLMYFTPEFARKVVECFYRSLVDEGWLIVSPCEASQVLFSQFKAVSFQDAVLYRKEGNGERGKGTKAESGNRRIGERGKSRIGETVKLRNGETEQKEAVSPIPPFSDSPLQSVPLCRTLANQGKLAEALMLLEQVIAADKLNPGLHYLQAMILQEQGADSEAKAALKRVLYLDQKFVLAHVALATLALRQGIRKDFQRYLENAFSLLGGYQADEILPESEGMTAGRLMKIIGAMDVMGDRDES
ncbi:MAG: hypothetical protein A2511_07800 [Deltaproteobacteria bacterium RIFOXYD12_FULL_50_9]|nr:MAG: hypothetical protein A2511_07800 [Deltaproteobacteria bacterium RIFOXYD12_FULL_50_9]